MAWTGAAWPASARRCRAAARGAKDETPGGGAVELARPWGRPPGCIDKAAVDLKDGPAMHTDAPPAAHDRSEAARYALLRRLAPSMRHHLVVNLQPIGMIWEVLDRRLRAPEPDLQQVHDSAHKIHGFARAALDSCLDVVTWLAPHEDATIGVVEGVSECVGLLATSFSFRGYALRNEVPALSGEVRRAAIRHVLTAALLQIVDEAQPPAQLRLTGQATPGGLALDLELAATTGDLGFAAEPTYRALTWADVQALAAADQVTLSRESGRQVRMVLPWVRPAAR